MTRAVLAVLALAGLLAMHGMSAQHEPMPTHTMQAAVVQHMTEAAPVEDTQHSMTELCFAILTGLVSVLLLVVGVRTSAGRARVEPAPWRLLAQSARASPRRPPSISELCVSRT